ncbi:eCIS core domain-containing protein [Pleomorphovibrio marinus]|uniref:eCIS core domain-containing protein n=1 Tax=Pleomorphovibrio marinus TaxID=2164132 RepID=UPI000E0C6CBA|nr:DUF4157 domain-containing protein [Pleomorphovibrio marinus]
MFKKPTKGKKNSSTYFKRAESNTPFFPQAKLETNQPGDSFEQEADHMADQVIQKMDEPEKEVQLSETEDEQTLQQSPEPEQDDMVQEKGVMLKEEEPLMADEEKIQMLEDEEVQMQEEEAERIQTKASEGGAVPSHVESGIQDAKGKGSPVPEPVKSSMEAGFGRDFGGVRLHTDEKAGQMSSQIGAQAFTHGQDIFFNKGKFNPQTSSGKHLLAHELTHTVQQSRGLSKKVQKEDEDAGGGDNQQDPLHFESDDGELDLRAGSKLIKINDLKLPGFKKDASYHPSVPFRLPPRSERDTDQRNKWDRHLRENETGITEKLQELFEQQIPAEVAGAQEPRYYLKLKSAAYNLIGTETELKNRIFRPFWNEEGTFQFYHVDHKNEIQLGGEDEIANYWLLDEKSNVDSGRLIKTNKDSEIKKVLTGARQSTTFTGNVPSFEEARGDQYRVEVQQVSNDPMGFDPKTLTVDDALAGEGVKGLEPLGSDELQALRGSPNEIVIFFNNMGGVSRRIPWEPEMTSKSDLSNMSGGPVIGKNFELKSINYQHGQGGSISGTAFEGNNFVNQEDLTMELSSSPIVDYGGVVSSTSLRSEANKLIAKYFSPISFSVVDFVPENGIYAVGVIRATLPVINDVEIDLLIDGDVVRISKTFSTGEFQVPPPFEIMDSSLTVFAGTEGLGVEGRVDFGIDRVGEGHIGASASTSGGFELEGAFNFDSTLFDPAQIEVSYKDEVWTIGGTIGIPEGKVPGVKTATITATYSEGTLTADGTAELDVPGVERGTMAVVYNAEGFSIAGDFELSSDIPGIRSGNVSARISKEGDEEGYNLMVSGTAQPDIPGISSTLSISYENGAITVTGSAAYQRGMLSGTLEVGASNREIGDEGLPSGPPQEEFNFYGGGTLTLRLTPWLTATAGVKFMPNGEMEVTARLSTDTFEVFPRREYNRNLFRAPTIEIPLFAIPLGPRSIGLVAQIGGGLDFTAGFGPGQLRNLSAEIVYNPDHEEETTLSGHGEFAIPADAGLTLRGDLGLGVSVGVASLSGGIELAGTLGLEGEAAASVDVDWTPETGITLDASGRIMVNPVFTFDINAFARASLGVGFLSISETWRHNLASFNWGPNLQFGIIFPIHYQEGQPFDMSLDDLEVVYPDIDVVNTAVGLARDIKNDLFD